MQEDLADYYIGIVSFGIDYPGLRANTAKETYGYTDCPYPDSTSGYPDAGEVREYLESCADHFGLYGHIKFNCEVVHLVETGNGGKQGFNLTVRSTADRDNKDDYEFSFVVICSGPFPCLRCRTFPERRLSRAWYAIRVNGLTPLSQMLSGWSSQAPANLLSIVPHGQPGKGRSNDALP